MTSHFSSIALIKSGLLKRSTLASTIIGVIPTDPQFNAKLDDNVQDNLGTAAVVVQVNIIKCLFSTLTRREKLILSSTILLRRETNNVYIFLHS